MLARTYQVRRTLPKVSQQVTLLQSVEVRASRLSGTFTTGFRGAVSLHLATDIITCVLLYIESTVFLPLAKKILRLLSDNYYTCVL